MGAWKTRIRNKPPTPPFRGEQQKKHAPSSSSPALKKTKNVPENGAQRTYRGTLDIICKMLYRNFEYVRTYARTYCRKSAKAPTLTNQPLSNRFFHMTTYSFGGLPFFLHPLSNCWRGNTYRSRTSRDVQNAGDSIAPPPPPDTPPAPAGSPSACVGGCLPADDLDLRSFAASSSDSELPRLSEVVLPWSDHTRGCSCWRCSWCCC